MESEEKTYLGHRQRLRDKFSQSGVGSLHDYEAMELLLTFAIPIRDVKPLAKAMLKKFGGLAGAIDAPAWKLQRVPGIGGKSAALTRLVGELAGALTTERAEPLPSLNAPEDVARFVAPRINGDDGEFLYALYLNSKNRPIGLDVIFEGRPDVVSLPRRQVTKKALERNARSIIFVHSMTALCAAEASPARPLAMALRSLASAVDIIVHDYIIMAGGDVMSARDKGWFKS